jgi:hypothetical protein
MTSPERTRRPHAALPMMAAITLLAGCAGAAPSGSLPRADASLATPRRTTATIATAAPSPERNPAVFVAGVPYAVPIDPSQFTTTVTNPYFPLDPGTTWTFDGAGEHVVVAVTDRTRTIADVTTIVVHDQGFEDGQVVEDTEDYYAQDSAGNVWYFGEVTGECDGHTITSRAGSWEAGVDGAQPGVVMLADPRAGDVYRQEYLVGEAEDRATVLKLDAAVTGPTGSYKDVLVTEDLTALEPDVVEHKSYAAGLGVIREDSLAAEPGVVELVKVTTGNPTPAIVGPFSPCQG